MIKLGWKCVYDIRPSINSPSQEGNHPGFPRGPRPERGCRLSQGCRKEGEEQEDRPNVLCTSPPHHVMHLPSPRSLPYQVVVATPRVLKPDEERLVNFYLKLDADALLIRSLGLLNQMVELGGTGKD